ncbi:MAG: ABC transporter substrate-binding protein [Desulfobacterales bacterium]
MSLLFRNRRLAACFNPTAVLWLSLLAVWLVSVGAWAETVRDHSGREIRFEAPFGRIISLYGAHTENLFSLGAEASIIGVSRSEVFPPAAADLPAFSYHDGPEKFLAAKPDLVLIRPMIERGYGTLVRQLERHGITVVSLQPADVEELIEYWRVLGRLTGRSVAADRMAASFLEAVSAFRALADGIEARKNVYFEAIHDRMKTFVPGSMPIFALETAGGVNVAADADQVRTTNIAFYGKERLLSKGDRIDVYLAQVGAMNRPTVEIIRSEPGYELIRAVQNGRIHLIDETTVSRPTLRLLQGIGMIGVHLYPEVFCAEAPAILARADLSFAATGAACESAGRTRPPKDE